jgi:glutamate N-acetyltransferase/amino-acid N-acetyltransferase
MSELLSPSAIPAGFRFAAVRAGIKASGKLDLASIVTDHPATAAALFTSNRVVAAPVTIGRQNLQASSGYVRAVVVNSGNANCATGAAGLATCEQVCSAAAAQFACEPSQVFPSSTGIIGVPLPGEKITAALPAVQAALGATADHFSHFARAILTTDTRPKVAYATIEIDGKPVRIAGAAKGAGMIHPQLLPHTASPAPLHATMLVYLLTDAAIAPDLLAQLLQSSGELSFNRISIDGDTSTNDTVLLLASGASGVTLDRNDPHHAAAVSAFAQALTEVSTSLARQIVDDGEGVTHVVTLEIEGAPSDAAALQVAKAIAHSPLVKTAWAGNDPNWGRLVAAIGYAGVAIDPARIDIWFNTLPICANGGRAPGYDEKAAHTILLNREFTIRIALGVGDGTCRFWTTDLTQEYVHINAAYST